MRPIPKGSSTGQLPRRRIRNTTSVTALWVYKNSNGFGFQAILLDCSRDYELGGLPCRKMAEPYLITRQVYQICMEMVQLNKIV